MIPTEGKVYDMKRLIILFMLLASPVRADHVVPKTIRPASERFAQRDSKEVPDFQRHVVPLLGRLGCNSAKCHGSFQGQGDFRLSLFGFDFQSSIDSLLACRANGRAGIATCQRALASGKRKASFAGVETVALVTVVLENRLN